MSDLPAFPREPPPPQAPAPKPKPPGAPSQAFVFASWIALSAGGLGFVIGLWRADLATSEKLFLFTDLAFGLFAVVSLQKSVRDMIERVPVTALYHGVCWFGALLAVALLVVGLASAGELLPSERGYYAFSFLLALFGTVAVQKNTRDTMAAEAAAA